jgi:DNA-binding SARP family transcriptional activator
MRLRSRKTQALLAYLALSPGQSHSRDKLATLLWGDRSQSHARSRLRESLFSLRRALDPADPPCLVVGGETLALAADTADIDAIGFERLARTDDPDALARAADLYRGDLLVGLAFRGGPFEEWLMAERERLRELAVDALARLLAHQQSAGPAEAALRTALRLSALDPLQEAVHRALMRLYARLGRRGSALRQYQLCVGVLQRELGVEPETDTRQLYQEILRRRHAGPGRGTGSPGSVAPPLIAATATPLIGRGAEMARLREALASARDGHGQLVAIVGEAGIGKTRLVAELATEALQLDARLLLGRCYESDQILPFGPWVDALRTSGVTSDPSVLEALTPAARAEVARLLPEVAKPGLPGPTENQLRLFESLAQLVGRVARQPAMLVLEDVHWADELSLRLLAFMSRRVGAWPVLVVATAREEELADASAARRIVQELTRERLAVPLVVSPLSQPDTTRLVRALARVGIDPHSMARLESQVWAVSEGNPFVAVETTQAFQEAATLPDSSRLPVPQRVRELIASRLERLSVRAREVASVAAAIGRDFEFGLLQSAGSLDEHATAEGVEELVRRHVLRGTGERFEFGHDRIRAIVYDQLLPPQRKVRHRRVGEALEARYAPNLEPHHLALATHFREAGVWEKAVDYFRRAGLGAMTRSAAREAVACFDQALGALEHLPTSAESIGLAIDLRRGIQSGYILLGELPRMFETLREAESLAQALGDERRLARVWADMVMSFCWTGQPESAMDYGQRALAIASATGDRSLEIVASARLGLSYRLLGDYRRAIDVTRRYLEKLSGDLARERFDMAGFPAVNGRVDLSACLAHVGDFAAAATVAEEGLRIATAVDHPYSVALAQWGVARWRSLQGGFHEALVWLERSLAACRRDGYYLFPAVAALTGGMYARVGRGAEGVALVEEAVERERTSRIPLSQPVTLTHLAEAYLLSGRVGDALQSARQALELGRARKQRGFEAETLHVLGEIQASHEPADGPGAEESYRSALALADDLGARPLAARCHLGLGRLYRQAGRGREAEGHLLTARTMLAAMEMRVWLEQADAELGSLAG